VVRTLPRSDTRQAARVTRGKARSFYLASLFLPASVRREVHTLYAFYRTVDDLVDEPPEGMGRQDILGLLSDWESDLRRADCPDNPFVAGAVRLVETHAIPVDYLCMVLEGARFDLDVTIVQTRHDLIRYSVLMAGSVGMVMSYLLGASDAQSLVAANDLGVAMQITNVLRDVGEDLSRARVYLPQEDLENHGYSLGALKRGEVDEPFCRLMRSLAHEARGYYKSGMEGIVRLDRSVQFSIYLAATLYGRILDKIEENGFNVFTCRASLNASEKWGLTMPTYLAHRHMSRKHS
jgi:15-cis-phytoene synthase